MAAIADRGLFEVYSGLFKGFRGCSAVQADSWRSMFITHWNVTLRKKLLMIPRIMGEKSLGTLGYLIGAHSTLRPQFIREKSGGIGV